VSLPVVACVYPLGRCKMHEGVQEKSECSGGVSAVQNDAQEGLQ